MKREMALACPPVMVLSIAMAIHMVSSDGAP
jgi:hypothetical protein